MEPPPIAVCLPTCEGERHLAGVLPALGAAVAAYPGRARLLAIDSSSTDGTRALLAAAGFEVETIPRASFGHGTTRNALAERAAGCEVCVFLSQDARPDGAGFLAALVAPFADPRVAGTFARVLPHEADDALTARTVLAAPEAGAEPVVLEGAGAGVGPGADAPRFNDVASALRRSVWAEIPFPDVAFGEDLAWAERALAAGHRLRFTPEAVVRHAHRYGPREAYARYRTDAAFHRATRGARVRPSLWSVARGIAFEVRADWRFVRAGRGGLADLARSPLLRAAQVLGQYAGGRAPW